MSSFFSLSSLVRSLFLLWALLCCFIEIICAVYGMWLRRGRYALLSLPCFCVCYLLWGIMMEVAEFYRKKPYNTFCLYCSKAPWLLYVLALSVCTVFSVWVLYRSIRYARSHITPDSIRLCADSMSCGICYWYDGGKVIFANECMTELCFALTGYALQNGEELSAAITEPILSIGSTVWSFTRRTVDFKGAPLHELIAADVTELYAKTTALKAENEEIIRYNEALRAYNLNIDETVRQQEILQAKANIHDEMNKLLLTTIASGSEGAGSVDDAFSLWQNNALLLCREAAEDEGGSIERLGKIAEALKISLIWHESIPEHLTKKQCSLFFSAAQEALANIFKHAGTKEMEIDFIETAEGIQCDYTNFGKLPDKPVSFTGGLGNLKSLAEMQGAEVSVTVSDRFTLSLLFRQLGKIRHLADVEAENRE